MATDTIETSIDYCEPYWEHYTQPRILSQTNGESASCNCFLVCSRIDGF